MNRVVFWGAASTSYQIINQIKDTIEIMYFVDMNPSKWNTLFHGYPVYRPEVLKEKTGYTKIIVGTCAVGDIPNQLKELGVSQDVLDTSYVDIYVKPRIKFLQDFSSTRTCKGAVVGEAGVFRGDFAKEINAAFPENKCFLFDTFEGFDARDFEAESQKSEFVIAGQFNATSEQLVLSKMPYPEMVHIFKGYFPETVTDEVLNEQYLFVNLDMDLYKPTLEGLKMFWPRMVDGGVILIHDYFNDAYPNVRDAVKDFELSVDERVHQIPIGDGNSVALIK